MYQKILVPLDGSTLAEVALPYAEEMAGRLGSEVILLSVTGSSDARDYHKSQIYVEKIINDTKRRAEKYLEGQEHREIKIDPVTLVGHPAEEIVNYADKEHIGLIIMATHGISGLKRWALGSVAGKVVRAAKQPVALIRAKDVRTRHERGMLDKLLVSLDGSSESEAVIPHIEELALRLTVEVTLFQTVPQPDRVYADAEGYLEKVTASLKEKGIKVDSQVRIGDAADEIIKMSDEIDADMVAMATHGRSGAGRWALGSVAEKVIQGGDTPVLLVRAW